MQDAVMRWIIGRIAVGMLPLMRHRFGAWERTGFNNYDAIFMALEYMTAHLLKAGPMTGADDLDGEARRLLLPSRKFT